MAVTGKMTVDLYANSDPFVRGMKAAADAAKKSGSGIAGSIEKINSKQLKSISGNLLGSIGIIGALHAGAKMANELVKGFKDGTLTGLEDAFVHVGNAFAEFAKNLPIAGALSEMIARGIVDPLTGGTMGQESAQEGSRGEFAKNQKRIAEEDKNRALFNERNKEAVDKIARESAAKQKKLDEENAKVKKFYANQRIDSEQEILKIKDDLRKASMSERDIEVERIQNLKTLPEYLKKEGIAAYDALVALREKQHLEKDIAAENKKSREDSNKQALDGQNDLAEARKAYAETEAELNAQAAGTSNVEGLSTAIGSIKVAGSTDFSIEKQMDIAKQQLNATELHTDILQEIADSLNAMGATT
jgi:hypothetical protein